MVAEASEASCTVGHLHGQGCVVEEHVTLAQEANTKVPADQA